MSTLPALALAFAMLPPFALPREAEVAVLEHELEVDPRDPLLGYRWDGGPEIPSPPQGGRIRIPYGEAGAGPTTVLYAPFHAGHEASAPALVPFEGRLDGEVRATGVAWTEGLFGSGLALSGEESTLVVEPRAGPLCSTAWSLELWVWLATPPQAVSLARAPGVFDVRVGPKGVCRVELQTEPAFQLWGKGEFVMGAWNHLALTVDGPDLLQVRLSVNGTPTGRRIDGCPPLGKVVVGGFAGVIDELRIDAYPGTSGTFRERWERVIPPGEHTLELRYADRQETVRLWSSPLTEPVLTGAEWQRGELEHAAQRDGNLRWLPGHWERYRKTNPPLPRTTHPTVYVGDHRVFLFGGETRDSHVGGMVNTNDTWIFHTDTGEWVRSRSATAPPPSCHQSAAYSPDHGVVLYAGGLYNQGDDLWQYDQTWLYFVEEDRWEQRHPGGVTLPVHSDGAIVYHPAERRFLLYVGGRQLATYDPDEDVWTPTWATGAVSAAGEPLGYVPGGSPMTGYDPESGRFVFFGGGIGGKSGVEWQDETALFDPATRSFTVLDTTVAPSGRLRSGFAYDSRRKRFVLFGGVLDQHSQRMDDLWIFRPDREEWVQMDSSNTPPPLGGFYHMAYDPELDRFLLLCGRHSHMVFTNDAWSLHLDEAATGRATYVFDRVAFPGLSTWFAEWTQPEGAGVDFRFRAGRDGIAWGDWSPSVDAAMVGHARFVQVEVSLQAGGPDAVPEVLRMGFAGDSGPPAESALGVRFAAVRVPSLTE